LQEFPFHPSHRAIQNLLRALHRKIPPAYKTPFLRRGSKQSNRTPHFISRKFLIIQREGAQQKALTIGKHLVLYIRIFDLCNY
jgi:hypothetical protein